MTITVAQFKLRFPEFDSIPDARIQLYIDDSILCFDTGQWGAFLDLGQSYFVAANVQVFEVDQSDPQTHFPVTNKTDAALSVGMSVSPISATNDDLFFLATKYGQKYLLLRDKVIMGILTVAEGNLDIPIPIDIGVS